MSFLGLGDEYVKNSGDINRETIRKVFKPSTYINATPRVEMILEEEVKPKGGSLPSAERTREERLLAESNFDGTLEKMNITSSTTQDEYTSVGKTLHHDLVDARNEFVQTGDSSKLISRAKETVKKSEPILKKSAVWKQYLLDILSALIFIGTLGISYLVTGRTRLFTAQTQASSVDEMKEMQQGLR